MNPEREVRVRELLSIAKRLSTENDPTVKHFLHNRAGRLKAEIDRFDAGLAMFTVVGRVDIPRQSLIGS